MPREPKRYDIFVCWVEETGMKETGNLVMRNGNWYPEYVACVVGKASQWKWSGTVHDVKNAKEYARKEGYTVLKYKADATDDNGSKDRARQDIVKMYHAGKVTLHV